MPRIARELVDGIIYHVINRGNNSQKVFRKDLDYKAFVNLMENGKFIYSIKILAYCLMPNHFHIVLQPAKGIELSKLMHWLMTSHVRRYHQHYGSSGHIWQGRFKNFIVQEDTYLLTVIRYVEANPIRAGLVTLAKDWQWSSYKETAGLKSRTITDQISIELPKFWESYVNTPLTDSELERLRQSVNRQSPYGAEFWQSELCKKLGLESTLRPRGRPKSI